MEAVLLDRRLVERIRSFSVEVIAILTERR